MKTFDTAPESLQPKEKQINSTARGQRRTSAPCVTEHDARLGDEMQKYRKPWGGEGMCPECAKVLLGKTFRSVRQVNRFDWDKSLTAPSRQPHLPALWAPAKLTWCNPGGTRPHSPVQPEFCCARARNGNSLPPGQLHPVGSSVRVLL